MSNRKILITNLFSLSGIQIVNFIIPALIVPYIVRIIGPDFYGSINFAIAFVAYFTITVNYGFDYSATREISVYRDNKDRLSSIFSAVIFAKIILLFITLLIFIPIIFFVPKFKQNIDLLFFTYLMIIGNIFLPIWLFQGLERLARLSVFNFLIKIIYAVSVILFVREKEDYLLIPLSLSISMIIVGVIAFFYSIKTFKVSFFIPGIKEIKKTIKDGWSLFLSTISINLYTNTNIVILGLFSSNINVGYFSASSKIIMVIQALILVPMNQTFFPRISSVINKSIN
ncbi:MAG: oligosaccharide flippase family protein, partial [Ignavibacteriaceae bacterium]